MSTITATDLIDELAKLKARNEEYRQGQQALVKENRQLRQEVGKANTDLTAATAKLAEIDVLQQKLWAAERAAQEARDSVGGLRDRAEKAEKSLELLGEQDAARKETLAGLVDDVARWEQDHSDLAAELDRAREEVARLEPFRNAVMALKQVLR